MHAGDNSNNFAIDPIENSIGEATDKCAPGFSMNHRMHVGVLAYIVKCGLNSRQELIAQPSTLALIPQKRILDIR